MLQVGPVTLNSKPLLTWHYTLLKADSFCYNFISIASESLNSDALQGSSALLSIFHLFGLEIFYIEEKGTFWWFRNREECLVWQVRFSYKSMRAILLRTQLETIRSTGQHICFPISTPRLKESILGIEIFSWASIVTCEQLCLLFRPRNPAP